jgi:CheY-like chemotaxis protein
MQTSTKSPKRADSPYASGRRTADWLKVKTAHRQEVVIAGFTAPRRTRPFFGALVLAVREDGAWRYIGHVGTGFSHQILEELHGKLMKLKTAKSPFPAQVKDERVTTWVRPTLVAEVKFAEWTSKGELRQPVYLGLRSDKSAKVVVREKSWSRQWRRYERSAGGPLGRQRPRRQGRQPERLAYRSKRPPVSCACTKPGERLIMSRHRVALVICEAVAGVTLLERPHDTDDLEAALAALRQERVELALVDLAMPKVSGVDVGLQLRQRSPRLPILFCSGFPDLIEENRKRIGEEAFLSKPYSLADLAAKIEAISAAKPAAANPAPAVMNG